MSAHVPLAQAAVPFGSVGQATQAAPQPVASLSAAHRALAPVPHRCVPEPQVNPQAVPSQVVALAPAGFGHPVHSAPQVSTLVFEAHTLLQLCVPAAHVPSHDAVLAMQLPRHTFIPVGHAGTHAVPSHVTEPPVGIWQAWQDVVPQLPTSLLSTHLPPHTW